MKDLTLIYPSNSIPIQFVSIQNYPLLSFQFLTLKYTIGIRMSLDHELKGSDAVEHNIHEVPKPQERNHALGKTVEYPERESPVHVQMVKANNFAA